MVPNDGPSLHWRTVDSARLSVVQFRTWLCFVFHLWCLLFLSMLNYYNDTNNIPWQVQMAPSPLLCTYEDILSPSPLYVGWWLSQTMRLIPNTCHQKPKHRHLLLGPLRYGQEGGIQRSHFLLVWGVLHTDRNTVRVFRGFWGNVWLHGGFQVRESQDHMVPLFLLYLSTKPHLMRLIVRIQLHHPSLTYLHRSRISPTAGA